MTGRDPLDSDPPRDESEATQILKVLRSSTENLEAARGLAESTRDAVLRIERTIERRMDTFERVSRDLEDQMDGCPVRKVDTRQDAPQAGGAVPTVTQQIILKAIEHPLAVVAILALLVVLLVLLASQGVSVGEYLQR